MGKLTKILDTFCLSSGSNSCFCVNSMESEDEFESKPLIASDSDHKLRLKDVVSGKQTLAFQLKPKIVTLRVSMHCHGCARKVEKHISKLEDKPPVRLPNCQSAVMNYSGPPSDRCYAICKKVKHGVSSYKVDLETKMVVVMGDILPLEVLESVSKVKNAELWSHSLC